MNRVFDMLRHVFISPEVLGVLAVWAIFFTFPRTFDFPYKLLADGSAFGLSAAGVALLCLGFCYREGFAMLDPSGAGSVLLEWPGYFMLKNRLIAAMFWCAAAIAGSFAATWLVASGTATTLGAALLASALLAAAISAASVALARIRIREILQSKS